MLRNLFSRLQVQGTAWSNIQSYNRNIVTSSCLHCNRKDAKPNSANIEYPGAGSGPIDVEESIEPYIPAYPQREGESLEILKARLLYQSRKRGMLENCLLLSTFASKFLESMNEGELKDYDRLINQPTNDWDIYYWATGVKPIPTDFDTPIMKKFILHVQNANRESRIMQPALYES